MTRIQIRRDTSTNWSVNNPTPANGEPCYETDTRKFKIGDGVTKYTNLPYQGSGGSGGGATIDDSTTATTSVWSSSKTNTEITTAVDTINSTKNDNIFDIGKFTVVGSPTITDDGIASGFNNSNYLTTINVKELKDKSWTIKTNFINNNVTDHPYNTLFKLGNWSAWGSITVESFPTRTTIVFSSRTGTVNDTNNESQWAKKTFSYSVEKIEASMSFDINTGTYTAKVDWGEGEQVIGTYIPTTENKQLYYINISETNNLRLQIGTGSDNTYLGGATDLKKISITVDGKEVFNGLMNSTKPIYDAIKANKTELSKFKTETSTDFSAVNSALNEKANLTDLALKQNTLVSGTNIKTINGETILGEGDITVGGSTPANMVTTDTAQDITANKTFYGEIRVGADNNYATLAKFSKEALVSGSSTLQEHIDLGEADFVVQGNLGKKVYETDKYVYKKYINVDDLSDNQIAMDNSISSRVAHMAMPSDKYIDLTLGASGTTYTAPADGWVVATVANNGGANAILDLTNTTNNFKGTAFNTVGWSASAVLPVRKGDVLLITYVIQGTETAKTLRFIYSVGSEPVV